VHIHTPKVKGGLGVWLGGTAVYSATPKGRKEGRKKGRKEGRKEEGKKERIPTLRKRIQSLTPNQEAICH
jgi:predicted transposase YdaD